MQPLFCQHSFTAGVDSHTVIGQINNECQHNGGHCGCIQHETVFQDILHEGGLVYQRGEDAVRHSPYPLGIAYTNIFENDSSGFFALFTRPETYSKSDWSFIPLAQSEPLPS